MLEYKVVGGVTTIVSYTIVIGPASAVTMLEGFGIIPSTLGRLEMLTAISLDSNQIEGSIPVGYEI
ncbi:hypothetical protein HN51_041368 [Arachis hypogaea]